VSASHRASSLRDGICFFVEIASPPRTHERLENQAHELCYRVRSFTGHAELVDEALFRLCFAEIFLPIVLALGRRPVGAACSSSSTDAREREAECRSGEGAQGLRAVTFFFASREIEFLFGSE